MSDESEKLCGEVEHLRASHLAVGPHCPWCDAPGLSFVGGQRVADTTRLALVISCSVCVRTEVVDPLDRTRLHTAEFALARCREREEALAADFERLRGVLEAAGMEVIDET